MDHKKGNRRGGVMSKESENYYFTADYFEEMVTLALKDVDKLDYCQRRKQVSAVIREVERDTRHKAAELAQKCAADIHNIAHKRAASWASPNLPRCYNGFGSCTP